MKPCSVVDLFCGVGGITHGFINEEFDVVAGVDCDPSCRYAYEHNNTATFIERKVEELKADELNDLYPDGHLKILVGCAPCQVYSKYASRYTKQQSKDDKQKWQLLSAFADMIDGVEPDIVSMENVPELLDYNDGLVYNDFVERLKPQYSVTPYLVYCPDYGIPQGRTRLVLFASRFGDLELLEKTHARDQYLSVRDAIGSLCSIEAGQACATDPLHRSAGLSDLNLRRIRQSVPGGTWRDWDPELVAECHKKRSGKTYASVYGRMAWDEPAPTMTTQFYGYGSGRFGHPDQDRALSLREGALLQTFPPNYRFVEPGRPVVIKTIGRQIGNAVPVDLGRIIARSIRKHMEEHLGD